MLMSPAEKLFQNEEREYAGQNQNRGLRTATQSFKGLGQQMNEGVAKQSAHGQTDHEEDNAPQLILSD